MTRVAWDAVSKRLFESGIDRGVLYPGSAANGVPWNGLIAVDEDNSSVTAAAYYFDGIRYLTMRQPGEYAGTLKAYTYPDEFAEFDGYKSIHPGFIAADQQVTETFGLTYRTRIGNDTKGLQYGYKLHLLYNLTATPENQSRPTLSTSSTPAEMAWKIEGNPIKVPGFRPTNHFIIDSTTMHPGFLDVLEEQLYGSASAEPYLPTPADLILLFQDSISEPLSEPL